jgi:hypothetical protein
MVVRSKLLLGAGAILIVGAIAAACGSTGNTGTGSCLPGATTTCACLGGLEGFQTCNADGRTLGLCQCGSGSGTGGVGGSTASGSPTATSSGNGSGGSGCNCNPSSELYCGVAACADAGSGTGTGGNSASDGGSCVGVVTFAGKVGADPTMGNPFNFSSDWTYMLLSGIAAGNQACQDQGADHVCDYDDLVLAASKGEIAGLATTDTAWLERTHSVTITAASPPILVLGQPPANGTTLQVTKGSRGADWTYQTDHLNDCEFVSFENGLNAPTYNLDDNPCAIQAVPKHIPCGINKIPRDVLCCFPKCQTVPQDSCTCSMATPSMCE